MAELIAAIATAPAPGGVGIIRVSGDGAGVIAGRVFHPKSGRMLTHYRDRQLVFGEARDQDGTLLDQCMAFYARGPSSYTGEDMAEIQCHGAPMVLSLVLEALFALGVRQALPGEFTRRAFLNGKLDLTQAEAVVDLIDAETPGAAKLAASQLGGSISWRVERIYQGLVDLLAHFYAVLDYPEEDIDPFRAETITQALAQALAELGALLGSFARGRQISYGVPCAIVGRPNAGKSSLLNLLLGYERAIVSSMPGTTRDTIEERLNIGGVLLRLIDTAGLRESADEVEQMGVTRSRSALAEAELALLVLDGTAPLRAEDEEIIALALAAPACLCLINKTDLPQRLDPAALEGRFRNPIHISARTGEGLDALVEALTRRFSGSAPLGGEAYLSNLRQKEAADRAQLALQHAEESHRAGMPPDLVLNDVEAAIAALGELTGKTVREDVTARIFERFCVGK